jgi:6-phosphofructokinase 1
MSVSARSLSIVVVAEGARPEGGEVLAVESGRPGHLPRLGGAGTRLLNELEARKLGHEVRLTVLGHLQRGGSPSPGDRTLGTIAGTYAAELCAEGRYDRMVVFRGGRVMSVPFDAAAPLHKAVDVDGSLVTAARAVGIELGAPPKNEDSP